MTEARLTTTKICNWAITMNKSSPALIYGEEYEKNAEKKTVNTMA